ncbi:MAG: D-glycero-beta-D-manno-heptose 1-phosphate adenylyltransferase [Pyrinomonadaceae bacterium]|nr:D-glycero-beta-D-manno-heptose 1-phosphate adenylyltransferase [Pyrinomonadaceae bacterium]
MQKIVFTNGCFDILHVGHLDLLTRARNLGTRLIIGINSDASVSAIKGTSRPIVSQNDRADLLRGLRVVDEVRIFDEPTPQRLIEEIKPDVLVKGGDWKINEIVGASFVIENGGEVFSLPLKDDFSTTNLVEKILQNNKSSLITSESFTDEDETKVLTESGYKLQIIKNTLSAHQSVFESLLKNESENISVCAEKIFNTLINGNKILLCGNGGSAADAQHIAAEFVGRYENERRGFPAIALTVDTSALTAIANDYGFERIFARQVEALAKKGDLLIGISTSGNSPNVLQAVMTARNIGCATIALTGAKGKKLASVCDNAILVASKKTARIQEAHSVIGHLWCEIVDKMLAESGAA